MTFIENLDIQSIIALLTSILVFIALFNEKVREFILNKLTLNKSKAELKLSANEANDNIINSMMTRISILSDEFSRLSDLNITTQKENYQLKSRISSLEYECKELKERVQKKCNNNCFDV